MPLMSRELSEWMIRINRDSMNIQLNDDVFDWIKSTQCVRVSMWMHKYDVWDEIGSASEPNVNRIISEWERFQRFPLIILLLNNACFG